MKNALRIFVILISSYLYGQDLTFQGSAQVLDAQTIQITPDSLETAGIVTSTYPIDITQDFVIEMQMYFGNKDANGGEGMAFILSNNCIEELRTGGNLGVENLPNSIIIDFDTNFSGTNNNDIYEDHTAVYNNGSFSLGSNITDQGSTPVCLKTDCGNVEDDMWHTVRIVWNYIADNDQIIEMYFDNVLRVSSQANHLNQRFNNEPFIFWSLSGSTGSVSNQQNVRIIQNPTSQEENLTFCEGEIFTLEAPPLGSNYVWSNNASDTNLAIYTATESTVITCSYLDYCDYARVQTFNITVEPEPSISITNNGPICEGAIAEFYISGPAGGIIEYNLNGDNSYTLNNQGQGILVVENSSLNETLNIYNLTYNNCSFTVNYNSTIQIIQQPDTLPINFN